NKFLEKATTNRSRKVAKCLTIPRSPFSSLGRITRGPNRKCSGGKVEMKRAELIRSTFDWAVCSEPLARSRRTRAYGYSIAECVGIGSNGVWVWPKYALEFRSKGHIVEFYLFASVRKKDGRLGESTPPRRTPKGLHGSRI